MIHFPFLVLMLFVSTLLGIAMGFLAMRKGYSFAAWFLTGGFVLLGAIGLGFMPNAKDPTKSPADRERMLARGNRTGLILSVITALLGFCSFGVQIFLWDVFHWNQNAPHASINMYQSLHKLFTWLQMLALAIILVMYLTKPSRERSALITLSLAMMLFHVLCFVLLSVLETPHARRSFELSQDMRMLIYFVLRIVDFAALLLLGIGLMRLQRKPSAPEPEKAWLAETR